jgi:ATP-dependent helicase/nuclease subunit A
MRRGTDIHTLLEVLPDMPRDQWPEIAARLVDDWEALLAEASAVLTAPELAHIFSPDALAEVPVTAHIDPLDAPIMGRIDRLIVADDHILIIDFKSNRDVPDSPNTTPSGFLKQMGAYADALRQVYPGKEIRSAILWTRTATLMELPENVTAAALRLDAPKVAT